MQPQKLTLRLKRVRRSKGFFLEPKSRGPGIKYSRRYHGSRGLHKKAAVSSGVTLGSNAVFSRGSTNTEPGAVATGSNTQLAWSCYTFYAVRSLTLSPWPGRYRSRFWICRLTERRSLTASGFARCLSTFCAKWIWSV